MRYLLASIFLSLSIFCHAQDSLKIYSWAEAANTNPDLVYHISFRKDKIDSLPVDLLRYANLRSLDLTGKKLSSLPSFFWDLKQLEKVVLSKNKFYVFPNELLFIPTLKHIIIDRNEISILPQAISNLVNLEYLDLSDNPIGDFPESLTSLPKLKKIELTGVRSSADFQMKWRKKLPQTHFVFDSPCDCMMK